MSVDHPQMAKRREHIESWSSSSSSYFHNFHDVSLDEFYSFPLRDSSSLGVPRKSMIFLVDSIVIMTIGNGCGDVDVNGSFD